MIMPIHVSKTSADYLRKIYVMVVDGDLRITNLMLHVLGHLGFKNLVSAQDGYQAVHLMREHPVDLIITDWELPPQESKSSFSLPKNPLVFSERWLPLPPKDGASFVRYIRSSKFSPNPYIPIIMLTGMGLKNHIEYARDCGVNEVMLKPLSMESLCQRITAVVDEPRPFVTAHHYKGPCRRRNPTDNYGPWERRRHDIKIIKHMGGEYERPSR
jgi:two-component system chemotaxis response regulator CheY